MFCAFVISHFLASKRGRRLGGSSEGGFQGEFLSGSPREMEGWGGGCWFRLGCAGCRCHFRLRSRRPTFWDNFQGIIFQNGVEKLLFSIGNALKLYKELGPLNQLVLIFKGICVLKFAIVITDRVEKQKHTTTLA